MGLVKNEMIKWEMDEPRRDWIQDQYGLDEYDIDTEEWKDASIEYDLKMANESQLEFDDWYYTGDDPQFRCATLYADFEHQINNLIELINNTSQEILLKMSMSYAITLMESCLKDLLLTIALASDENKRNALTKIDGLKQTTIPLSEVMGINVDAYTDDIITKHLIGRTINYHKISVVVSIFQAVVGRIAHDPKNYFGEINKIIELRHDLVHRDGKTIEGNIHKLVSGDIITNLTTVKYFVLAVVTWLEQESFNEINPFFVDDVLSKGK